MPPLPTSSKRNDRSFPLLNLPRELRDLIYSAAITHRSYHLPLRVPRLGTRERWRPPFYPPTHSARSIRELTTLNPVLMVNRQVRSEALAKLTSIVSITLMTDVAAFEKDMEHVARAMAKLPSLRGALFRIEKPVVRGAAHGLEEWEFRPPAVMVLNFSTSRRRVVGAVPLAIPESRFDWKWGRSVTDTNGDKLWVHFNGWLLWPCEGDGGGQGVVGISTLHSRGSWRRARRHGFRHWYGRSLLYRSCVDAIGKFQRALLEQNRGDPSGGGVPLADAITK